MRITIAAVLAYCQAAAGFDQGQFQSLQRRHAATALLVTGAAASNAALAVGKTLMAVELPKGVYERYLGILCTTGTTTTTAGKVNAFLTNDPVSWKAFDAPFQL